MMYHDFLYAPHKTTNHNRRAVTFLNLLNYILAVPQIAINLIHRHIDRLEQQHDNPIFFLAKVSIQKGNGTVLVTQLSICRLNFRFQRPFRSIAKKRGKLFQGAHIYVYIILVAIIPPRWQQARRLTLVLLHSRTMPSLSLSFWVVFVSERPRK